MTRRNLATSLEERWPPPLLSNTGRLRRFADLQFASIWNDLIPLLMATRGTLIDAGCGNQPYRSALSPDVVYEGVEVEEAAAHFGHSMPGLTIVSGYPWPFPDSSTETILCTEVLEHTAEPRELLRELWRLLIPGGQMILTVPFSARWHFIPYDFWRFTPSGLSKLLSSTGFEDVRVHARGNPTTVVMYKIITLLAQRRALGVLLSPVGFVAACIGHLSLRHDWGDDCLGFTVLATKPLPPR